MSNQNLTSETEQFILNHAKDSLYDTIDVTPFLETTQGSVAARQTATASGTKVAADVAIQSGFSALGIPEHDYIGITYVAAGDGAGEIQTVTYKSGGSGGTTVATLTLAYDSNDQLSSVTKT